MADGRLDEACEIAQSDEIRRHRQGQRLTGRLARALLRRGRENLDAGRFAPAMSDCNKAEKLAGGTSEVAQLRAAISEAVARDQQGHQQEAQRVAQAKRHADGGWLSVGERILAEAPAEDAGAEQVRQELRAARLATEDAVEKAEQALRQGDVEEAMEIAQAAGLGRSRNGSAGELVRRIRGRAVERMRADFEQGRVDRAGLLLTRFTALGRNGTQTAELSEALTRCRRAAEHVRAGRPSEALPLLRKIKAVYPSARWLDSAISDVKRAADAYDELDAGPLGLTTAETVPAHESADMHAGADGAFEGNGDRGTRMREHGMATTGDGSLPSQFILQMDGIGGFLVFRDARITAGPISSSGRPMLGLIADPSAPVITIERIEGDYFVRAKTPVEVNGRAVTETLLSDGDRIVLSPRCRLRFNLPNPASGTAVLTVSGTRLGRPDIKQVLLMDRDILVGPYANNHVRTDQVADPIALFAQNGRLLCRAKESIMVDGRSLDPSVGLAAEKRIEIGKLSMVVTGLGE